ncbi:MAG: GDP-L-fucose synthase [Gemmatimonadetes bacterium]|nr:GDP-L-fucose synthase [Gemmatimonadota bacterium]
MKSGSTVFVAGHKGLVGSAIVRRLSKDDAYRVITADRSTLDLTDARMVDSYFDRQRPEYVFLAAAKVGGILANDSYPGDFIRENLSIQISVLEAARRNGVSKLLFLGSSCIYPRLAPQPIREDALLTGPLEATNEAYAIAKIAGIKMCQGYRRQYGCNFIAAMPTNLYGPGDNFDLHSSHVLPALIRKFHEAKEEHRPTVQVWGSGKPRREFLHVDDLADACVHLMNVWDDGDIVNVGVGQDITIAELAEMVQDVVGYPGKIQYDATKPDGTPRKLLDVSRMASLGWQARIPLRAGIESTYRWFLSGAHDRTSAGTGVGAQA